MTATKTSFPTTIAATTVDLSRRDGEHGAARIFRVEAEVEDFGADWADHPDVPEARYAYRTMGFVETRIPGGAIASDNVVGNGETTWFDEAPATTTEGLADVVRAEHADYGIDPFADDEF